MTDQQAAHLVAQSVVKADVGFSLGNTRYCVRNGQLCDANGELVVLRAQSALVLDYLLEHNEMVVSKETLASAVWPRSVASDESISKCISDIRKSLGDDAHSILETYPKRGYRINAVYGEPPRTTQSRGRKLLIFTAAALTLALVLIALLNENGVQRTTTTNLIQPINAVALTETERVRRALSNFTYEGNLMAERHFRTAIEQDPEDALAYAELVATFAIRLENG